MPTVVFTSFGTKQYEVVTDTTSGTFYVLRHADNETTYRFVCSEGFAEYIRLKSMWRLNRRDFNRRCATFTYYKD